MLQRVATDRHQMFYTAHQFSSRESLTERGLHSPHTVKATAFSFSCHCGTAAWEEDYIVFPHVVKKTQRSARDEANALNNAV